MITARTHWHSSRDIMNRDKQNTTCYISHVSAYISHFFIQYLEAKVEAVLITVFNVQLTPTPSKTVNSKLNVIVRMYRLCVLVMCFLLVLEKPTCTLGSPGVALPYTSLVLLMVSPIRLYNEKCNS